MNEKLLLNRLSKKEILKLNRTLHCRLNTASQAFAKESQIKNEIDTSHLIKVQKEIFKCWEIEIK
jgi:hypothetical protein